MSFTQRSLPWQNRSSRIEFLKASELPKRSLEFLAIYSEESSSRISPFTSLLINLRTFLTNWVIWLSSPLKKKKKWQRRWLLDRRQVYPKPLKASWEPDRKVGRRRKSTPGITSLGQSVSQRTLADPERSVPTVWPKDKFSEDPDFILQN